MLIHCNIPINDYLKQFKVFSCIGIFCDVMSPLQSHSPKAIYRI